MEIIPDINDENDNRSLLYILTLEKEVEELEKDPSEFIFIEFSNEKTYDNPWIYQNMNFITADRKLAGFVYLIINKLNNKKYIGKKSFWFKKKGNIVESDWKKYYGSCDELTEDVKKYGNENFSREILYLCRFKKTMTYYEIKEQFTRNVLLRDDYYNTNIAGKFFIKEGYIYECGEKKVGTLDLTTRGYKWIHRGEKETLLPPNKELPKGWIFGKSGKFKENRSNFMKGNTRATALKGRKQTEEHKKNRKIYDTKPYSVQLAEKMGLSNKGKKLTEEHKKKISETLKKKSISD